MKILFLASDLALPGQGGQLARLAAAAKDDGHEVAVASLGEAGEPGAWLEAKGVKLHILRGNSWRLPAALGRFALRTLLFRPDILQTWGFKADIAGKTLGFFCGARNIVASLRSPETPKRMELQRVSSFLSARTVANSKFLENLGATCGLSQRQLSQASNSCDFELFKPKERMRPSSREPKWKILYLGRRSIDSGTPALMGALGGLAQSGLPFKAKLVGPADKGFDLELIRYMEQQKLTGKVELKDSVPHAKAAALMEDSHLLVAPQVLNWTPNSILEACASGLPVVATGIEGVRELLAEGKAGRLASPGDPLSLAKAMADAIMEYEVSLRLAREALKLARERHASAQVHGSYLALYKELLQP